VSEDQELEAFGEFLSWQYGKPYVEHWEDLTEPQRNYWRQDARTIRDWLDQWRKMQVGR
jgi:hypothetical protein